MTVRCFRVFTEPHVADPAWVAPVFEELPYNTVMYADATELQKVVSQLQFDLGRQSGRTEESVRAAKYLKTLGWTDEAIKAFHFWRKEAL